MKREIWNQEAERAVLGSALLSSRAAEEVFCHLKPGDFFSPTHVAIATHLERLVVQRTPMDLVAVRNSLMDADLLAQVGGIEYLIECAQFVPNPANATIYAKIVKEKSSARRLERFARQSLEIAQKDTMPSDQKLAQIENCLIEIAGQTTPDDRKVIDLSEVIRQLDHFVADAKEKAALGELATKMFPSRFKDLQDILGGFEPGCVYTTGARSSMGKTSYFLDEACHLASLGHPVLFVSREMTPLKLTVRVVAKLARIPVFQVKAGRMSDELHQKWMDAQDLVYKLPIRYMTSTRATIAEIRREARIMEREVGAMPVIFDDYIQMALNGAQNMHVAISQMMTDYKTLAKEMETPVLILSQLSRAVEGRSSDSRRPTLADLKESGSIEENSDAVILLYREEYYEARKAGRKEKAESEAEFIVAKNREGGLGVAKLRFRPAFTEFLEY